METFFVTCAALGGAILTVQLLLGLAGIGEGAADHASGGTGVAEGLDLLSVRALSAGLAFFGVGGWAGSSTGLGVVLAIPLALVSGGAATVTVAALTRWLLSFESDGTVGIEQAVGATGTVYLTIPGKGAGAGKVHVVVQGRIMEYQAVTAHETIPTGASVMVVDTAAADTLVVVPTPFPNTLPSHEVRHAVE